MADVSRWLADTMGMGQYVEAFAKHGVDGRLLSVLEQADLEEDLGVQNGIHRKRILLQFHKALGGSWAGGPGRTESSVPAAIGATWSHETLWSASSAPRPPLRPAVSASISMSPNPVNVHVLQKSRAAGIMPAHLAGRMPPRREEDGGYDVQKGQFVRLKTEEEHAKAVEAARHQGAAEERERLSAERVAREAVRATEAAARAQKEAAEREAIRQNEELQRSQRLQVATKKVREFEVRAVHCRARRDVGLL